MTDEKAFSQLATNLTSLYKKDEARTITRYIFEDMFDISYPPSEKEFEHEDQLHHIQKRLLNHEPWQHVVGFADFYGRKFKVSSDVLIPRPETEELVQMILDTAAPGQSVLDIGTGSGCIAVSLKKENEGLEVHALDVSEKALAIAQENASALGADIIWYQADILDWKHWPAVNERPFDVIASNPPYVLESDKKEMNNNVLNFDPPLASFVSDEDPLIFYNTIADFALKYLKKGGRLYFEIHQEFGPQVVELLEHKGFTDVVLKQDVFDNDRFVTSVL